MSLIVALDTVYVIFVHFTIYNTRHNPPKIIKYIVESIEYSIIRLWGSKMQMKRSFMVLEIWLFGYGMFWSSFANQGFYQRSLYEP